MKRLLLLLTMLSLSVMADETRFGDAVLGDAVLGGAVVSGGGGGSNTVDWSKGFESGALETGLTETDTLNRLNYADTTNYHSGSKSMSVVIDVDSLNAYLTKDTTAVRSNMTVCFWFYAVEATASFDVPILVIGSATPGTYSFRAAYVFSEGTGYGFRARGVTYPALGDIMLSATNAWYRLEMVYSQGATSTLKAYNVAGSQVGSTITVTANNTQSRYVHMGIAGSGVGVRTSPLYWDDVGIDYTDSTTPLWPFEVSN